MQGDLHATCKPPEYNRRSSLRIAVDATPVLCQDLHTTSMGISILPSSLMVRAFKLHVTVAMLVSQTLISTHLLQLPLHLPAHLHYK